MKRKLIEQVTSKPCMLTTITASSTTANLSSAIDRIGYLSAHIDVQSTASAGDTAVITITVYDSTDSTGTYTIYDSANATITHNASSSVTVSQFDVDLLGADRYLKVYATAASATITTTLAISCTLGDAITEPCT